MITVHVFYPNQDGAKFDMGYYLSSHIPMLKRLCGPALKGVIVEQGIAGGAPGTNATYGTICQLRFDSLESFQTHFGPHAEQVMKDVPNYTNLSPIIQISDIKMS